MTDWKSLSDDEIVGRIAGITRFHTAGDTKFNALGHPLCNSVPSLRTSM